MPQTSSTSKGIPPWVWIGCGCFGAIGALVVVVGGLGFWGFQKARDISETMNDPAARNAQALEVLGAESLPEGYETIAAFSVPFAFDYVALSDHPPGSPGPGVPLDNDQVEMDSEASAFIYMSFPSVGDRDEELYDFFEGRGEDLASLQREQFFDLDLRERVAEGRIARGTDELLWVSHRGSVHTDAIDAPRDGLVTMMLFECNDSRRRVGIWSAPRSSTDTDELAGSVADKAKIDSFTSPFNPCR